MWVLVSFEVLVADDDDGIQLIAASHPPTTRALDLSTFPQRSHTPSGHPPYRAPPRLASADAPPTHPPIALQDMRLKHLEEQAMLALKLAVENHENPVFPNAMIAGDTVITHLLDRLGYLKNGKVTIMCVDTYHLFPETMEFLKEIEDHYGFKAEVFAAEGCADKAEYDKKFGADLWMEDVEQYDKVCKVEPFQRGLKTCKTDVMINGRTRWQGFERAYIDLFENAPIGGGLAKVGADTDTAAQLERRRMRNPKPKPNPNPTHERPQSQPQPDACFQFRSPPLPLTLFLLLLLLSPR